jgi:dTDP-4-amino-4,6-dideoxygalactose transaminase
MIPVTKPFSPPIEEYQDLLNGIWERNWYTNNGPLVIDLEEKLRKELNQKHLLFVTNGTIALQIAIKALNISKKIITTPFSYVATTSSIIWEGCTPVFVDIDPETFNIDATKIEAIIDEDTEAILATHCFGNPCDINQIELIAKKYNLKVIYDAAHCFGTMYKGKSIFSYGDVSTVSFHATKLFHTVEGGAVFTNNPDINQKMAYMRNFGHDGPEKFNGVGINGKNSEFHAAMGLVNLKYVDTILKQRRALFENYDTLLESLRLKKQKINLNSVYNFSYYPVVFKDEATTLKIKAVLEKNNIFPRRYFYPSLSSLDYVQEAATFFSNSISSRILCLPLYHDLTKSEQVLIANILIKN